MIWGRGHPDSGTPPPLFLSNPSLPLEQLQTHPSFNHMIPPSQGCNGVVVVGGWQGFQAPCSVPREAVVCGLGLALAPASLNQPSPWRCVSVVSSLFLSFVFSFFFFLAKIFCKGPGNWGGAPGGGGGQAPFISSEAGGVNLLQQQLKRKRFCLGGELLVCSWRQMWVGH